MDVAMLQYPPGDPRMIDTIVHQLKSQGIFDQFRKECIADVDTKPAYQNLHQRVEGTVSGFLAHQVWRPDLNKNQVRESLRKHIHESGYLDLGVERIVDQVVNPKIMTVLVPQVEDVVYKFIGIEKPKKAPVIHMPIAPKDLLPKDLDPVSPESDVGKKSPSNSVEEGEFDEKDGGTPPPFTTLETSNDNSMGSHLSGISGLTSPDDHLSNISYIGGKTPPRKSLEGDSNLSKVSLESVRSLSAMEIEHSDSYNQMELDPPTTYERMALEKPSQVVGAASDKPSRFDRAETDKPRNSQRAEADKPSFVDRAEAEKPSVFERAVAEKPRIYERIETERRRSYEEMEAERRRSYEGAESARRGSCSESETEYETSSDEESSPEHEPLDGSMSPINALHIDLDRVDVPKAPVNVEALPPKIEPKPMVTGDAKVVPKDCNATKEKPDPLDKEHVVKEEPKEKTKEVEEKHLDKPIKKSEKEDLKPLKKESEKTDKDVKKLSTKDGSIKKEDKKRESDSHGKKSEKDKDGKRYDKPKMDEKQSKDDTKKEDKSAKQSEKVEKDDVKKEEKPVKKEDKTKRDEKGGKKEERRSSHSSHRSSHHSKPRKPEEEGKKKIDDGRKKEEDFKKKSDDAKKKEDDVKKKRDDFKKKEDDVKKKSDDMKKKEEHAKKKSEDVKKKEDDAKKKGDDAKRKEDDAKKKKDSHKTKNGKSERPASGKEKESKDSSGHRRERDSSKSERKEHVKEKESSQKDKELSLKDKDPSQKDKESSQKDKESSQKDKEPLKDKDSSQKDKELTQKEKERREKERKARDPAKRKKPVDDHRVHRERRSEDRRSADGDSNGAAREQPRSASTSAQPRHKEGQASEQGGQSGGSGGNSEQAETNRKAAKGSEQDKLKAVRRLSSQGSSKRSPDSKVKASTMQAAHAEDPPSPELRYFSDVDDSDLRGFTAFLDRLEADHASFLVPAPRPKVRPANAKPGAKRGRPIAAPKARPKPSPALNMTKRLVIKVEQLVFKGEPIASNEGQVSTEDKTASVEGKHTASEIPGNLAKAGPVIPVESVSESAAVKSSKDGDVDSDETPTISQESVKDVEDKPTVVKRVKAIHSARAGSKFTEPNPEEMSKEHGILYGQPRDLPANIAVNEVETEQLGCVTEAIDKIPAVEVIPMENKVPVVDMIPVADDVPVVAKRPRLSVEQEKVLAEKKYESRDFTVESDPAKPADDSSTVPAKEKVYESRDLTTSSGSEGSKSRPHSSAEGRFLDEGPRSRPVSRAESRSLDEGPRSRPVSRAESRSLDEGPRSRPVSRAESRSLDEGPRSRPVSRAESRLLDEGPKSQPPSVSVEPEGAAEGAKGPEGTEMRPPPTSTSPGGTGRRSRQPSTRYSASDYSLTEAEVEEPARPKVGGRKRLWPRVAEPADNNNERAGGGVLEKGAETPVGGQDEEAEAKKPKVGRPRGRPPGSKKIKETVTETKLAVTDGRGKGRVATPTFVMPLSPESDVSASSAELANRKAPSVSPTPAPTPTSTKRATAAASSRAQRYSSDDLYKPRPLFSRGRRARGPQNDDGQQT